MQFQDLGVRERAQLRGHPSDLPRAGHEHERVHGGVLADGARVDVPRGARDVIEERGRHAALVEALRPRRPHGLEGVQRGRAVHDRRGLFPAEQRGEPGGVDGRGQRHDHEVLAQLPQVREHAHEQVGVHGALVHLIQDHRGGAGQFRVRQQPAHQDPRGHELDPRPLRHPPFPAHAPANDAARLRSCQRGQPPRRGPGGHPAGLDHDDAVGGGIRTGHPCEVFPDRVGQHRGHQGGFAGSRRGLHHGHAPVQRLLQSRHGLRERQAPADPVDVERGGTHGFQYGRAPGRDC